MPKKRLWLCLAALCTGIVYLAISISSITSESLSEYHDLYYSQPSPPKGVRQEKIHVRKDVWLSKDGVRHHHALLSPSSKVEIIDFQPTLIAQETFPELQCYLQEDVSGSFDNGFSQELRVFKANSGTYNYSTQTFIAHEVNFSNYQLSGNKLPIKDALPQPFLAGKASTATLNFNDHEIQAKANHVQATIFKAKDKSL